MKLLGVVLLVMLMLMGHDSVWGQVSSSISGTVQDTTGANVPGATVTVKNLETAAARTVVSGDNGAFRVLTLPVGRYEIRAAKEGFKTAIRTGVELVVGQEAVVTLNLEIGQTRQEVTVSAQAALV